MNNHSEIKVYELDTYVEEIASRTANRTLELTNQKPLIITYSRIKKLYGEAMAKKAWNSPKIMWHLGGSGGKTSGSYCCCKQFEAFLFNKKMENVNTQHFASEREKKRAARSTKN